MKVLQISNYYYPLVGGTQATCQYLSEGIKDEYDVHVVAFSEDKEDKEEEHNGVRVSKAGVFLMLLRQSLSFSYYKLLKKYIVEWKPDIIHFHHPNPFVMALMLRLIPDDVKLYVHYHLDVTAQKFMYQFIKGIERKMLERADMIATTSENYKKSSPVLKDFQDKTVVLASAIDIAKYDLQPGEQEKVEKIKQAACGKKIVFHAGRHVRHKGLEDLIEAEKLIKSDCVIYVGGDGPTTDEMMQLAKFSDRIRFLGRMNDSDLRCYYHAADVFAFPSYTKAEGFGLTLAEAMYCGTPAVTYTIEGSGVNWVCPNGETGLEVPNRDVEAYAAAIDKLLQDDELRKQLSENARSRVVTLFTIQKEVETLKEQYAYLLNKKA